MCSNMKNIFVAGSCYFWQVHALSSVRSADKNSEDGNNLELSGSLDGRSIDLSEDVGNSDSFLQLAVKMSLETLKLVKKDEDRSQDGANKSHDNLSQTSSDRLGDHFISGQFVDKDAQITPSKSHHSHKVHN